MVKNKVLTPVLAGVLGLSVAGSAVGFAALNKSADKNDTKPTTSKLFQTDNAPLAEATQDFQDDLAYVDKIINGDIDFAYDGSVTFTAGKPINNELGYELAPIKLATSAKQKGDNAEFDYTLFYDNNSVVNVNAIYARGENVGYLRIPELSDAYLSADIDSIQEMLADELDIDFNAPSFSDVELPEFDFDEAEVEKNLEAYSDAVKNNLPAPKPADPVSGSINGYSYSLTAETYELGEGDLTNIANAVLDVAKGDQVLKSAYDETIASLYEQFGSTYDGSVTADAPSYEEIINELQSALNYSDDSYYVTFPITVYKDADGEFAGFMIDYDGARIQLIEVYDGTNAAVDFSLNAEDELEFSVAGSISAANDELNGGFKLNYKERDKEIAGELSIANVKSQGDFFSGTVRIDGSVNSDYEAESGWLEIASNSTPDELDLNITVGTNGTVAGSIYVEGRKTEATDVALPGSGDKVFNALDENELDEYSRTINEDAFLQHLKDSLGSLYNELYLDDLMSLDLDDIMGGDDYYDDDYYDYYDFEDYDFDYDI